ncbi:MAG: helix-turn-helix domain-containing protein [Patescibacteria group bacterium]
MNPNDALAGLDLKEKEIIVYKALLELGEVPVTRVTKQTGLKRPTTYAVLKSLEGKGFVSRTIRGKKMLFAAQHPKKLVTEAEIRLKELQAAVPQLESIMGNSEQRPRVVVYEGKDALDKAYDDSFVTKGEILYMGDISLSQEVFPRTFAKVGYVSLSPEFKIRELDDDSDRTRKYAEEVRGPYRQVRFIPKEFLPFQMDIGIFGNTVLITSVKKEYFTVKIESEEIARGYRALFEAMWRISSE